LARKLLGGHNVIKVLHIVHALTRGGGLCNFIMNYYRTIDRTRIQFDFLYFKEVEDDFKDEITQLGGKYYKMSEPSTNPSFIKEREDFFRKHKGDYTAIHCHVLFAAAIFAKTAKKYGVENIIVHSHSTGYGIGFLRKIRNYYLVKQARRLATCRLACSEESAIFMFGKKAVYKGTVAVIRNAIDCNKYIFDEKIRHAVREDLGIKEYFVVGHVGGFVPLKNHLFLIDVFKEICKIIPDSVLILVGGEGTASGSTKSDVMYKVEKLGLTDKVKFLGIRKDVNRLMMAMDVFVFPSVFEGFGLVMVEAQTTGLPSFASTSVPNAVKCTDLAYFLPLSAGPKEWAATILQNNSNQHRRMDISGFEAYDIRKQKEILENIYLEM